LEDVLNAEAAGEPTEATVAETAIACRVSKPIVECALLTVREAFVRFFDFLELVSRPGLFVAVRVILKREPAVRLADLVLGRAPADAEHVIVVSFCSGHGPCSGTSGSGYRAARPGVSPGASRGIEYSATDCQGVSAIRPESPVSTICARSGGWPVNRWRFPH